MKRFLILPIFLFTLQVSADEATHKAAVQELLKVTKAEQLLIQSLSPIEGIQKQLIVQLTEGKDRDSARAVADQVLKSSNEVVMAKLSWTAMEAEYTRVYMRFFSEEEVRGMVEFYKSPLGQKVLEKTPALMGEIVQMTSNKIDEVVPEIQAAAQKSAEEVLKKKAPTAPANPHPPAADKSPSPNPL